MSGSAFVKRVALVGLNCTGCFCHVTPTASWAILWTYLILNTFVNSCGGSRSTGRHRHTPPLSCGSGHQGRPLCRRYHCDVPGLPVQRETSALGRGHDRRDHPERPGAAGGFWQRTVEGACVCSCETDAVSPQVGGIKDKVLAAHRAGVKCIILPKRNEKDLEDLPANVRANLDFITVSSLDQVLNGAFDGGFPGTASVHTHRPIVSKL